MSNLLEKASIVLTPTAYDNGSLHSVKPVQTFGSELITNGDFATDSNWSKGTGWTISGGTAVSDGSNTSGEIIAQTMSIVSGKTYQVVLDVKEVTSGNVRFYSNFLGGGGQANINSSGIFTYNLVASATGDRNVGIQALASSSSVINSISVKEVTDADFDFTRGTAATRVNSQGLIENVQILSGELVQNGDFEQIGSELVTNGDFEQIGSELIPDGNFTNQAAVDYWGIASSRATKSLENGFMRLTYDVAIGGALLKQSNAIPSGKSYKVTFRAKGTANSSFASIGDNDNISGNPQYVVSNPTLSSDFQNYEFNVPLTGSNFRLYLASAQIGDTLDITNISVKEVGQDWTLESGWSISNGKLLGTLSSSANAYQQEVLEAGKIYKITYEISNYSQGGVRFQLAGGGGTVAGTSNFSNGVFTETLKATVNHTSIRFRSLTTDGGFTGSIDNVSVKEVGQNWTFGTGWSIGDGKAIFDGGNNQSLTQDGIVANNKKYKLTYTISNYVQGGIKWRFGTSSNLTTVRSANGTYVEEITSTGSDFRAITDGASELSIDNILVIEVTDDTDLPRIDYSPYTGAGTCGHWLLEPQSTNLVTYSEDLSQSSWQKQSSGVASAPIVTSNYSISPDGTLNADRVVFNINAGTTSSDFSQIADQITNNTGDVTNSIFIKSNTTSNYNMSFVDPNANYTSIVVTTEWQRFDVTSTTTSTASAFRLRLRGSEATSNSADVSVWGAQVEEQSYATSYIPTRGTIVPRNQDIAINSGNSNLISQTEGVLYCEIAALFSGDGDNRCITLSDGTGISNTVEIFYQESANTIKYRIKDGNGVLLSHTETVADRSQFNKIALKYKSGDNSMWLNGVKVDTDTSTFSFTTTLSKLNFAQANNSQKFFGKVKSLAVFKEALTDAELTCLTS